MGLNEYNENQNKLSDEANYKYNRQKILLERQIKFLSSKDNSKDITKLL